MEPVRRLLAALIGEPLVLPAELANNFPELSEARYRVGGLPPRIGALALGSRVSAVTVWRTIFLERGAAVAPELLLHELRHVHQFGASATFPLRYLWACVRWGYHRNPFEIATLGAGAYERRAHGRLARRRVKW